MYHRLLGVIREATAEKRSEPNDRLILRVQTPSGLDEGREGAGWQSLSVTAKLFVSYSGAESLSDVTISVHAQPPFKCDQETQVTSSTSPNPQPEIPNPNPEIPNPNADAARSKGDRFPQTATYTLTPNL